MRNEKEFPMENEAFQKFVFGSLTALELNIHHLFHEMNEMARKLQKLDEVYYHVFPDRVKQDEKFEHQLGSLNSAHKPEAPSKKS